MLTDQAFAKRVHMYFVLYLALDAAEVQQVEVAGQDGLEGCEGLQGRDAAPFGQDGQRQDLVVQQGVGHVTEYGGEAGCCSVHHLEGSRDRGNGGEWRLKYDDINDSPQRSLLVDEGGRYISKSSPQRRRANRFTLGLLHSQRCDVKL